MEQTKTQQEILRDEATAARAGLSILEKRYREAKQRHQEASERLQAAKLAPPVAEPPEIVAARARVAECEVALINARQDLKALITPERMAGRWQVEQGTSALKSDYTKALREVTAAKRLYAQGKELAENIYRQTRVVSSTGVKLQEPILHWRLPCPCGTYDICPGPHHNFACVFRESGPIS